MNVSKSMTALFGTAALAAGIPTAAQATAINVADLVNVSYVTNFGTTNLGNIHVGDTVNLNPFTINVGTNSDGVTAITVADLQYGASLAVGNIGRDFAGFVITDLSNNINATGITETPLQVDVPELRVKDSFTANQLFLNANGDNFTEGSSLTYDVLSPVVSSAVVEPATWAMMLGGFAMMGGAIRNDRKRKLADTAPAVA